mmetsp:Transcript_23926/g.76964  ORF Transcript_23926/g.76964 Transcript_23926/m.76964 type:complete len:149 (-) Transcript_23926:276-722(-)
MGGRPTRRLLLLLALSSSFSLGRLFLDASVSEEACLSHDDFDLEAHSKWSLGPEEVFAFEVSQGGKKASTFGHATVRGAASLVRHWQAHRERPGLFFDLGSGNGHVVLYAAIVDNASTESPKKPGTTSTRRTRSSASRGESPFLKATC